MSEKIEFGICIQRVQEGTYLQPLVFIHAHHYLDDSAFGSLNSTFCVTLNSQKFFSLFLLYLLKFIRGTQFSMMLRKCAPRVIEMSI